MKYVINVIDVEKCPENWTSRDAWPGNGIYKVKSETHAIYHVYEYGVNYISPLNCILDNPYKEPGELISETLLLKAIAAASRAEVLK